MRVTITQKLTITILFSTLSAVGIVFFLILPTLRNIRSTTDAMITQIQSEDQEFERVRMLRKSLLELDSIKDSIGKTAKLSITRSEEDETISLFESVAQTYNVEQSLSVSFQADTTIPDFSGYYLFTFVARGSYENIRAYFSYIESLPYYLLIKNITLEKEKKSSLDHSVILRFNALLNSTSL